MGSKKGLPTERDRQPPGPGPAEAARWVNAPGSNLVGVPTGLLASAAFHEFPLPLHIAGTRESHAALFAALQGAESAEEAGRCFQDYMERTFGPQAQAPESPAAPRRFRANYLRLLKGWGYDSNSPEGAVMKAWVESRFGIPPTYHRTVIRRFAGPAWIRYMTDRMSSRFDNNNIRVQLDVLYEFAQWAFRHFFAPGQRHLRLFRGTNDFAEHLWVRRLDARHAVVRLNNLVSFTADRDIAGEFGDIILEVQVPAVKVLFFNGLLPRHPLKGEAEYLVIGGDYAVRMGYF